MDNRYAVLILGALLLLLRFSSATTGSDTDPCAFTDRVSLLDRIESDWQEYNISLLVETCNAVCSILYGTGNPDISGIGVSVLAMSPLSPSRALS